MKARLEPAPESGADRITLVMLPGAGGRAQDLIERGFVRSLRRRVLPVDALVVDAGFDDYLENTVAARLERDVVAPARAGGGARIWMMGISLGGLGALSHAREHGGEVEGVVLLAPFLGNRGLVAEVIRAGGLDKWQPGAIRGDDTERLVLAWLAGYRAGDAGFPEIYVGYGADDRYAPASMMLGRQLSSARVVCMPGGHDWETWLALWETLLDGGIFSRKHASTPAPFDSASP